MIRWVGCCIIVKIRYDVVKIRYDVVKIRYDVVAFLDGKWFRENKSSLSLVIRFFSRASDIIILLLLRFPELGFEF